MKKIISMILVCVLLVGMLFTLASCGKKLKGSYSCEVSSYDKKLMGSYSFEESGIKITYEFKGNKFTGKSEMEIFGQKYSEEIEGTYKIKDDEITMTYEYDGEEVEETLSFEKGKDYIVIDGVEFVNDVSYSKITYEFKGNKFTGTYEFKRLGRKYSEEIEGTYKIKGDEITMTYELDGEEVEETYSFEKGKDYIVIDDMEFTKD